MSDQGNIGKMTEINDLPYSVGDFNMRMMDEDGALRHRLVSREGGGYALKNVNGHTLTIVGVAAQGFEGTTLGADPDIFVPVTMRAQMNRWWDEFENRRNYWAYLFGRLKPGVSIEQANAELNTIYSAIINDVEAELQSGMSESTLERFRAISRER